MVSSPPPGTWSWGPPVWGGVGGPGFFGLPHWVSGGWCFGPPSSLVFFWRGAVFWGPHQGQGGVGSLDQLLVWGGGPFHMWAPPQLLSRRVTWGGPPGRPSVSSWGGSRRGCGRAPGRARPAASSAGRQGDTHPLLGFPPPTHAPPHPAEALVVPFPCFGDPPSSPFKFGLPLSGCVLPSISPLLSGSSYFHTPPPSSGGLPTCYPLSDWRTTPSRFASAIISLNPHYRGVHGPPKVLGPPQLPPPPLS